MFGVVSSHSAHHTDAYEPQKPPLALCRGNQGPRGHVTCPGHTELGLALSRLPGQLQGCVLPSSAHARPLALLKLPPLTLFPFNPCSPISPPMTPQPSPSALFCQTPLFSPLTQPSVTPALQCTLMTKPQARISPALPSLHLSRLGLPTWHIVHNSL